MTDVANQVSSNRPCKRCRQRDCICGVHAFELGALMMAVGRYLHRGRADSAGRVEHFSREELGAAYRELAARVPGQMCSGCTFCPPVKS